MDPRDGKEGRAANDGAPKGRPFRQLQPGRQAGRELLTGQVCKVVGWPEWKVRWRWPCALRGNGACIFMRPCFYVSAPLLIINLHPIRFIGTFRAHVGPVFRATWAPDSRLLITASEDSTIKLWKVKVRREEIPRIHMRVKGMALCLNHASFVLLLLDSATVDRSTRP